MAQVLFIGPYSQKDGWGLAAKDYGIAMSRMPDHDVYFKRVQTTLDMESNVPPEILEREIAEIGSNHTFDIVIQNYLPSNFTKIPDVKNIGLFYSETINFAGMNWIDKCNETMDAIIVPTNVEFQNIVNDGVKPPVYKVAMPMKLTSNKVKKNKEYTFYFIGEFSDRKNIEYIITEYLAAFTKSDNVTLLIKTSNCNTQAYLDYVNRKYRMFNDQSPKLRIISEYLSDAEIQDIHDKSHCFVSGSKGESTCRPLINALYCNNYAIFTGNTGMSDALIYKTYPAKSIVERCNALNPPIPNIYNGLQFWRSPITGEMANIMKRLYNNRNHNVSSSTDTNIIKRKHSYDTAAIRLNSIINEVIGV